MIKIPYDYILLLTYPMILPGKPWIATFTCRNIAVNRKADNDSISMQ